MYNTTLATIFPSYLPRLAADINSKPNVIIYMCKSKWATLWRDYSSTSFPTDLHLVAAENGASIWFGVKVVCLTELLLFPSTRLLRSRFVVCIFSRTTVGDDALCVLKVISQDEILVIVSRGWMWNFLLEFQRHVKACQSKFLCIANRDIVDYWERKNHLIYFQTSG